MSKNLTPLLSCFDYWIILICPLAHEDCCGCVWGEIVRCPVHGDQRMPWERGFPEKTGNWKKLWLFSCGTHF